MFLTDRRPIHVQRTFEMLLRQLCPAGCIMEHREFVQIVGDPPVHRAQLRFSEFEGSLKPPPSRLQIARLSQQNTEMGQMRSVRRFLRSARRFGACQSFMLQGQGFLQAAAQQTLAGERVQSPADLGMVGGNTATSERSIKGPAAAGSPRRPPAMRATPRWCGKGLSCWRRRCPTR